MKYNNILLAPIQGMLNVQKKIALVLREGIVRSIVCVIICFVVYSLKVVFVNHNVIENHVLVMLQIGNVIKICVQVK